MLRTFALLFFVAASALGVWQGSLKVRFDVTLLGIGTSAFIELPQSNTTANSSGWVVVTRPDGPTGLASLVMWCPSTDYSICVLYDDTGYVAGLQIAFDVDNFSDNVYDWVALGFTYWTTEIDGVTKNYWTTQQYYISAETLATDAATRIASRDSTVTLQDTAVWVSGFDGELYAISTNVSLITADDSDFTQQACVPGMGNHYYYKLSNETVCDENYLLPWFPLVYSDQLIGVGLFVFGKYTVSENSSATNWFEAPGQSAVKYIIPRGPDCVYNLAETPGVVSLHTYFIEHPYAVTCIIE